MNEEYSTLDALALLGFEQCEDRLGREALRFRFQTLDLLASVSVSNYLQPTVLLSGIVKTRRTLGLVEHYIPPNLERSLEAAAWVSFVLRDDRSCLKPLPAWFLEGERHWNLVPPGREKLAIQERLEASREACRKCPKCFIDREYARPFRHKLRVELSELYRETDATFSFDGRVLSISLCGTVHEVIASGDGWKRSYRVGLNNESKLPARFRSSTVTVMVVDGKLRFDGEPLGPCETNG